MYIHPYSFRKPSVFKFTQLMQNKNMSILKKLGKYIYEAFDFEKSLLSLVYMHNLHPGANLLPGAKLHPGVNLHPLM